MYKFKEFLLENKFIILIIILSVFLKLWYPRQFFLNGDSSEFLLGGLEAIGDSSIENCAHTPPGTLGNFYYYLIGLPFIFYKSIFSPVLLGVFFNVLSVYVCYKIGNDFFSEKVGLISAFLYTTTTFSIILLRGSLYYSYITPFFSLTTFYFLLSVIIDNKSINIIPLTIVLFLSTHMHGVMLTLIPIVLIGIILYRPNIKFKYGFITLLIILLLTTFSFTGMAGTPEEHSLNTVLDSIPDMVLNFNDFVETFSNGLYSFSELFLDPAPGDYKFDSMSFYYSTITMLVLFVLGVITVVYRLFKTDERKKYAVLILIISYFFFLPFLIYSRIHISGWWGDIFPRYFVPIYPIVFLFISIFISEIYESMLNLKISRKLLISVFSILLVSIIVPQITTSNEYLSEERWCFSSWRLKLSEILINEYDISEFDVFEKNVNFLGFNSPDHGFCRDGLGILNYLDEEDKNSSRKENNVLILSDTIDEGKYVDIKENLEKGLNLSDVKDYNMFEVIEYEYDARECKKDCVIYTNYNYSNGIDLRVSYNRVNDSISFDINYSNVEPDDIELYFETGPLLHIDLESEVNEVGTEVNKYEDRYELLIDIEEIENIPNCNKVRKYFNTGVNILRFRLGSEEIDNKWPIDFITLYRD